MKEFIWTIIVLTIGLTICLVQDAKGAEVSYNNMNSSFETMVKGDTLTKLETWEQPRTEYTPKNLRSQYQLRFSGKDGSNRVTSYTLPITDYDTYINAISKDEESGKMYVHDNAIVKYSFGEDRPEITLYRTRDKRCWKKVGSSSNSYSSDYYLGYRSYYQDPCF